MICLLPHCAYLSETTRMIAIHHALTARGERPLVLTHGGPHARLLAAEGIAFEVLGTGFDEARSARFVADGLGLGRPDQSIYTDDELLTLARAEADWFRRHDVRVAVTGFTLTTLLSTRLAGVRLVTEHAGSFVPPVIERLTGAVGPARTTAYVDGFNRAAEALGVAPVPSLAAVLLGDLSLVPEVPEVLGLTADEVAAWTPAGDPGYRPESRLAVTGPLFAELDLPVPARVERFVAGDDPVVYVAPTSTSADVVRALVRSLATLPAKLVVAATVHDLADLASPQVLVEQVLPSHRVMPLVDLAVTTAGQGSVQTAMATGTPVLGVSLHAEQDLNIALLERLGAGRALPVAAAGTAADLADAMLAEPNHRAAAQRVQRWYDAVDGPALAAEAVLTAAQQPAG